MSLLKTISTVWRKEVHDNFRDRRTVLTTLLMGPVFGPILFAALINFTVSEQLSSVEEDIEIAVVGSEHASNLTTFLESQGITKITGHEIDNFNSAIGAVRSGNQDVVVLIEKQFGEQLSSESGAHIGLVFDQSNNRAQSKVSRVRNALQNYSSLIGRLRLVARGVQPGVVEPIIVDNFDVSTASGRSALLLGMATYFLLLASLMGGLYLAIDTTAGERERKSLEPLFATPASKTGLLLGKLAATVSFMTITLALTLASFTIAITFLPLERIGMSSAFGPIAAIKAFAVIFPFLPLAAALMTMIASFSKNYKEAQSQVSLVMLLPTLPLVVAAIMNVRPSLPLMFVPSLSQHLLVTNLVRGESVELLYLFVSAVWTLLLGVLLTLVSIKLFKREGFLA